MTIQTSSPFQIKGLYNTSQVGTPIEKQPAVSVSSKTRTAGANIYSEALTLLNFLASAHDRDFPPMI